MLKEMPIFDDKYKEKLKTLIGQEVSGVIDRPVGSKHPKYDGITYQVNYGYINELTAPDGEKQDAYFVGINKPMKEFKGVVIAIIDRIDDIEDKLVVAPLGLDYTDDEIEEAVHFQEQFFKHQIIRGLRVREWIGSGHNTDRDFCAILEKGVCVTTTLVVGQSHLSDFVQKRSFK